MVLIVEGAVVASHEQQETTMCRNDSNADAATEAEHGEVVGRGLSDAVRLIIAAIAGSI
jgi:hypothetical protein